MIVRLGVGDREADGHDVKERRFGHGRALRAKVSADVEREFKYAGARVRGRDERSVGAPVRVGLRARDQRPRAVGT